MSDTIVKLGSAETALQAYLDHLLAEATVEPPLAETAVAAGVVSIKPVPVVDAAPAPAAVTAPAPVVDPELPVTAKRGEAPDWGAAPFQVLVCEVGRLRIAVPLIKLREVLVFSEVTAVLPNAPDWILGLLQHRGRQVHVVDTRRLIMPRQEIDPGPGEEPPIRDVLLVGDGGWGLGCQEIGEVMVLQPEDVHWRSAAGKRPWLAGTVVEQLCALIDVDVLPDLLQAGKRLA